jgi:hypothetical protein
MHVLPSPVFRRKRRKRLADGQCSASRLRYNPTALGSIDWSGSAECQNVVEGVGGLRLW